MAHIPVMLSEVLELLQLKKGMRCIDMTVGLGGHSAAMLGKIGEEGFLLGLDRDAESLPLASEKLKALGPNFRLEHSDYAKVFEVAKEVDFGLANAILCDCGISSYQLDSQERGFGFGEGIPLDMRLDRSENFKASDLLNTLQEDELSEIFFRYGDERLARPIARAIVRKRTEKSFEEAEQLAKLVSGVYFRKGFKHSRVHPATRVFQALRVAVNHELLSLEEGLDGAIKLLAPGGRLAVISFHSGEDRIVKLAFRRFAKELEFGSIITKKPLTPGQEEIAANPRARSALLRVFEKNI